jgi:hypothetical protein
MPTIAEKSNTDAETGDDAIVPGFTLSDADLAGLPASSADANIFFTAFGRTLSTALISRRKALPTA